MSRILSFLFILFIALLITVGIKACNELAEGLETLHTTLNSSITDYDNLIGERVVLNGDTLDIVDYSWFNSSLKLSNGIEISKKYTDKIIIKPDSVQVK